MNIKRGAEETKQMPIGFEVISMATTFYQAVQSRRCHVYITNYKDKLLKIVRILVVLKKKKKDTRIVGTIMYTYSIRPQLQVAQMCPPSLEL